MKSLHEEIPKQTRQQVADEEIRAAEIHLTVIEYVKKHPEYEPYYGDEEWNTHWYEKHSEAAYYILNPPEKPVKMVRSFGDFLLDFFRWIR